MPGVLAILLGTGRELPAVALEVAGAGRQVADELGEPLVAVVAGKNVTAAANGLAAYGVDRALVAEDTSATPTSPDWLLGAALQAVELARPTIILLSHSGPSRELGPRLSAQLKTGIVGDCTALRVQDGRLVVTKPVFGGSALAEMEVLASPQMATLRPRAFEAREPVAGRSAEVVPLVVGAPSDRVQVLDEVQGEVGSGPRLKDAKVIVSGGRGLGGPENWHYIEELAQVLDAAVGATRAVTDAGWVAPTHQVGLTGSSVAPDLYITVGISGAVQHIAGISGARNVVAINRDADANIFKYARYGIVGDWKQALPAFTERVRQLRGS
jgi:electron transfer flavoprotein alpha subunit